MLKALFLQYNFLTEVLDLLIHTLSFDGMIASLRVLEQFFVNLYNLLPNILSAILDKDIYEGDQYYISNNIDTMVNYTYFLENNTYIYHHRYDVAYPIEMTGIAKAFYFTLSYALYILEKDDYLDFIINFSPNDYSTAYTKY